MNEEKLRILKMVEEGKITAQEGAKLLEALESASENEETQYSRKGISSEKTLKITITNMDTGNISVNLNIPLGVAHFLKSLIPPAELEKIEAQGIKISELIETIESGQIGRILDVEDQEHRQHIQMSIE